MLSPLKAIKRAIGDAVPVELYGLRTDPETGYIVDSFCGHDVILKSRRLRQSRVHVDHLCKSVYFPNYVPMAGELILDFGVGFGYECAYIASLSAGVRYIGIEIQPSVFECVSLTMGRLGEGYRAFPLPLGDGSDLSIQPTQRTIDATTVAGRGIPIPSIRWPDMIKRLNIDKIDYLKMNIEGAETATLREIDLKIVSRVAVSCHDFLADRGLGESYRTITDVSDILESSGFIITRRVDSDYDFERGWVYGSRN